MTDTPDSTEPRTDAVQAISDAFYVALDLLQPSPTNPRKRFSDDSLAEMAETIVASGVMQNLIVRPNPAHQAGDGRPPYEIVSGERRWRSCRLLRSQGKTWPHDGQVPVRVRQLDDRETLAIQLLENIQREDLHPLEECDHYHRMTTHPSQAITVDEVARQIGRSPAYVYGRLALRKLVPAAREAFLADKLDFSKALKVAAMPPQQQPAIVEHITTWGGEPMGVRATARYIHDHHTLQISGAPFSPADAHLVPDAGPCTSCPKRSSLHPQLFADTVAEGDRCLDAACWALKRQAHRDWMLGNAKAEGYITLTGDAVATMMSTKSGMLTGGWHDLKAPLPSSMGNASYTVQQALTKANTEASCIHVALHPVQDLLVYAVSTLVLETALRQAGLQAQTKGTPTPQQRIDAVDDTPPPAPAPAAAKKPKAAPPAPAPAYDPLDDVLQFPVLPPAASRVSSEAQASFSDTAFARLSAGLVAHKVAGELRDRGQALGLLLPDRMVQLLLVSAMTLDFHFDLEDLAKLAGVEPTAPDRIDDACAWALALPATEANAMLYAALAAQNDADDHVRPTPWRARIASLLGISPEHVDAQARQLVDERLRLELLSRGADTSGGGEGGGEKPAAKKAAAKKPAAKAAAKKAASAKKAAAAASPGGKGKKNSAGVAGVNDEGAGPAAPRSAPAKAKTKVTDKAATPPTTDTAWPQLKDRS